jgi:hypothetical protein
MARYERERAVLGNAIQILDVPYQDIVRDPMPVIREIYQRAGVPWTATGEAAMHVWPQVNQQHKFGKAVYSLERYGLTAQGIRAAFPVKLS